MNIVFSIRIIFAWALLSICLLIPKILSWVGIDALEFMLTPIITMAVIIIAGLILTAPLLLNPARAVMIIALIVLVAVLVTMGMYYGTINPIEASTISLLG